MKIVLPSEGPGTVPFLHPAFCKVLARQLAGAKYLIIEIIIALYAV